MDTNPNHDFHVITQTDDALLDRLLAIAHHPKAADRSCCPSLDELEELARIVTDRDHYEIKDDGAVWIAFDHLHECELCQGDFECLRTNHEERFGDLSRQVAAMKEDQHGRAIHQMAKELFELSTPLRDWTQEDLLFYRPLVDEIIGLAHQAFAGIQRFRRTGTSLSLEMPDPSQLVDRVLASALATMRSGDTYMSTTTIDFWRSILTDPKRPESSAFFRQMTTALGLGVRIRRILPVSLRDQRLLRDIARMNDTGDANEFSPGYSFLIPHLRLLERYDNYEFRVLVYETARYPEPPRHCGIGRWRVRGAQLAFVPTYRDGCAAIPGQGVVPSQKLCGATILAESDELRQTFETAWADAFDVRSINDADSSWLHLQPIEEVFAHLAELPTEQARRLYRANAAHRSRARAGARSAPRAPAAPGPTTRRPHPAISCIRAS